MRVRCVCSQNAVRAGLMRALTLHFRGGCYLAETDFSIGPSWYGTD
jgi:hypothetical protein